MSARGEDVLGSWRPPLLRPAILLFGGVTLAVWLLATASPAVAGGLAPDPAPAAGLRPDPYPSAPTPQAQNVARPAPASPPVSAPAVVSVTVATRVAVHPRKAPLHHRPVVQKRADSVRKAVPPLVFPTLALEWLSAAGTPVARRGGDVPARVALVLAALVLASAMLVAAAAREATR